MKKLIEGLTKVMAAVVGRKRLGRFLVYSAKTIDVNLHQSGLLQVGAGTTVHLENGSELFFIQHILSALLKDVERPVLFDVGANMGNYTKMLREQIANGDIFAF